MKRKQTKQYLTNRQEKNLLRAAAAAIPAAYPNPEHYGCPEPSVVRNLARRRVPLGETGEFVDHVATCAPCFEAYSRYRRRRRIAGVVGPVVAAAVCLLAIVLLWPRHSSTVRLPKRQLASSPSTTSFKATLDYRQYSPSRSEEPAVETFQIPHLRKGLLDLTILLPLGTEDGSYSIGLRTLSGKTSVEAAGTARWDGSAETLTTTIDLREVASGEYRLAIHKDGASWRTYALILEESK